MPDQANDPVFALAEHFHSIQGEGSWAGTPMHFIRMAGCSVGHYTNSHDKFSICRTYDGRQFTCDTNYHTQAMVPMTSLLEETWEHHICLTGGEPLMWLRRLIDADFFKNCRDRSILVHIETSGTIRLSKEDWEHICDMWITCSPKYGYRRDFLSRVDEVKLLVDEQFVLPDDLTAFFETNRAIPIFIQPINDGEEINQTNLEICMRLLREHPDWMLSPQVHKLLKMR